MIRYLDHWAIAPLNSLEELNDLSRRKNGAPFLLTPVNKSASDLKERILDVRFPMQKNRRVIFQCGYRSVADVRACHFVYGNPSPSNWANDWTKKLHGKCTSDTALSSLAWPR
ncbi:hypothetical protein TNCV_863521 [Trichonephila clavipes]|nr:hypothetical protein TNCV_863521 [Trichonephila clavipes]